MTAALPLPARGARPEAGSNETLQRATADSIAHMRTEMLRTFLEEMHKVQIPYCLLNGFHEYPEVIASDVDFMIQPEDAKRIAPLLMDVAGRCGALLLQNIRHETEAWYFVLAKQAGGSVAYLHPDCTTDYRRDGRLWMEAKQVIERRQGYKSFFVPAIADEFLYYLIKKILKQCITEAHWRRIVALYLSRPEDCGEGMRRFWSNATADGLVAALLRDEIDRMRLHLPSLLSELRASAPVEKWWERARHGLREWRRRFERVVSPTGLSIAVCGGTRLYRAKLAGALEESLRPAFRRTLTCAEESAGDGLWGAMPIWRAKARSTLVIRKKEFAQQHWLVPDEIEFVLSDTKGCESGDERGAARNWRVMIDSSRPLPQNLERATRMTLQYLAARLQRRVKGNASQPIASRSDA
jgi:hypothetical protein